MTRHSRILFNYSLSTIEVLITFHLLGVRGDEPTLIFDHLKVTTSRMKTLQFGAKGCIFQCHHLLPQLWPYSLESRVVAVDSLPLVPRVSMENGSKWSPSFEIFLEERQVSPLVTSCLFIEI